MQIFLFILGFLLFISLVIVHEWGHFKAARRNDVEVEEFGLGFPPKAWSKKTKAGMVLSLNWLPLGGFVKMKGESDSDTRKNSFGAASLGAKTKIMLAGVTMNLIVGVGLLVLLALLGMPKVLDKQSVGQDQFTVASDTKIVRQEVFARSIIPDTPAAKSGLANGDVIVGIEHGNEARAIKTSEQLIKATHDFAGQKVFITYRHNGQTVTRGVTLLSKAQVAASLKTDNPKGNLGLEPGQLQLQRSTWSAPIVALGFTKQLTVLTFQGLGHALGGLGSAIAGLVTGNHAAREKGQAEASSQVGGPVAIVAVLWDSGSLGIYFMLFIIAIISLTLAIMNILPIPALDGGRLAMMLFSRGVFKRPLSQAAEERIVGASMAVLLLLVALITVVDVKRFF
jgi:regulator of sigma E protease